MVCLSAQQPPGQVRPRPAEGREPELPQPRIREYRPRSTLVVPQHPVPRARFPVVDFHHHPPRAMTPDDVNRIGETMGPLNLQVMVNANATSGTSVPDQAADSQPSSRPTSAPAPSASES